MDMTPGLDVQEATGRRRARIVDRRTWPKVFRGGFDRSVSGKRLDHDAMNANSRRRGAVRPGRDLIIAVRSVDRGVAFRARSRPRGGSSRRRGEPYAAGDLPAPASRG
ncbi:hypothetical protein [Albimonas pacifica]|uniref:hypothetical protein n=1 Tax=Albimonas pacifica TaxID=1114924 RepID=UPI001160C258|nr:hypothetical protein [Albimonas pacifica]